MIASKEGYTPIVLVLLEAGAEKEARGKVVRKRKLFQAFAYFSPSKKKYTPLLAVFIIFSLIPTSQFLSIS